MSRVLIDSNVFIYAFDPKDPAKHERAIELIEEVTRLLISPLAGAGT